MRNAPVKQSWSPRAVHALLTRRTRDAGLSLQEQSDDPGESVDAVQAITDAAVVPTALLSDLR